MKNNNQHVSVVMPCLNEEETLGACIERHSEPWMR